jgi:1D-myo-inositol-tetrakisphosphate 5-kinase/inositol-polyphosphate multikinase
MVENKDKKSGAKEPVSSSDLPLNAAPLVHQVAGHFHGKGQSKLGLLQTHDGLILKPVQSPPSGQREHQFYRRLFKSKDNELGQDELELKKLLPTYRGSLIHNDGEFQFNFLV